MAATLNRSLRKGTPTRKGLGRASAAKKASYAQILKASGDKQAGTSSSG